MKHRRLWTGLSSVLSSLLVITILTMNCMLGYSSTINSELGIKTSEVVNDENDTTITTYYESEFGELNAENLQTLIAETYTESVLEQEEGSVLLKNDKEALPLSDSGLGVTLFSHSVVQPLYKASSAGSSGYTGEYCIDLYTALTDAGFKINDTLYDAYSASSTTRSAGGYDFRNNVEKEWSMGEEDISFYTDELKASWENDYNDVAIVLLAREGGEGIELYTETPTEGISSLALSQEEKDLFQMIKDSGKFKKTIVLVNSGNAMELDWLDEYEVDACLWIGLPGQRGFEGVANILTGEANPSGALTDTYAVNSLSSPAVVNGSFNNQTWTNLDEVLAATTEDETDVSYYTVQAESIYIGYKYYETRYEDTVLNQGNADSNKGTTTGSAWNYNDEVSYPFGYGLSYTSFAQKLESVQVGEDTITVNVNVTNTGSVAGKAPVQVYAQTPYGDYEKENLVEKSAIQLLDFGKTGILQPGESETVTIECDKYLLASYDYINEKGYIISEGDYYISIGDDAHDALNNVLAAKGAQGMVDVLGNEAKGIDENTYKWSESFDAEKYNTTKYTDNEVTNLFDDADINYWVDDAVTYLSRNDWDATYPVSATQVAASEEMVEVLNGDYYEKPEDSASISDYTQGDNQNIPLAAMIGLDYDDSQWETYLNQFTIEQLTSMLADSFGTAEIAEVGKPEVVAGDGPDGVGGTFDEELYGDGRDDTCFPSETVLAATFNKELMQRRGELIGEECLYLGFSEVWMPGVNLHRTPFGGRNFEYYSEDANMNYLCQIPEVQGMESKGVHAGAKHLAGNDQENNRMGVCVFFNEQAFREGALRGCEGSLTEGGGMAVMHAFNRLGLVWCSSSYALCTDVVVNEWGFVGHQQTDAIATGRAFLTHFSTNVAAGVGNFCLDFSGTSSQAILADITNNDDGNLLGLLRNAMHNYLYSVANSSLMNGYSVNSTVVSVTPWWQPMMYAIIAIIAVLDVVCIGMLVRTKIVKEKKIKEAVE